MLGEVVTSFKSSGTQVAAVSGRNGRVGSIKVVLQRHLAFAPGENFRKKISPRQNKVNCLSIASLSRWSNSLGSVLDEGT